MLSSDKNKTSIKPSSYLPSYLKLDLNVGVAEEHPFISALDATFEGWCAASQCESLSLSRSHFPLDRKKSVLEGYGFQLGALNDTETSELYAQLHTLFRNQGALTAVQILAGIYFSNQTVAVRRGRGFKRQTLKGAISFPILAGDREDDDRTVQISLTQNVNRQRAAEFIANALRFVPYGFQITLQEPLRAQATDTSKIDLGAGVRLIERRI